MSRPVLLDALSGFWHRFFSDMADISALYEGVEILAEQVYLDLLHEVLSTSVRETPLSRKEGYRLWRISGLNVRKASGSWVIRPPVAWKKVRYLQDGVVRPTVLLDADNQFTLTTDGVAFANDPRDIFSAAASRMRHLLIGGKMLLSAPVEVYAGDTVLLEDGRKFKVLYATPTELGFEPQVRVSQSDGGVRWTTDTLGTTVTSELVAVYETYLRELGVWAVDADVDDFRLFENFGYLYGDRRPSEDQYRAFIKGLSRLDLLGPTVANYEAALTVAAGMPLSVSEGETVLAVTPSATATTVLTDKNTYVVPAGIPLRPEITVGVVLRAFTPITDAVKVLDHVRLPYWWDGLTLPRVLMPKVTERGRLVTTELFANRVGSDYKGAVGNPHVLIGDKWHRTPAYSLVTDLLQYNMFGVKMHPALDNPPGTLRRLQRLAVDARPSGAYAYVYPDAQSPTDSVWAYDDLVRDVDITAQELLVTAPNRQIGTGRIGDGVSPSNETLPVAQGGWPLVIGGGHPDQRAPADTQIADGALHITVTET